jgi:hypothetical protein
MRGGGCITHENDLAVAQDSDCGSERFKNFIAIGRLYINANVDDGAVEDVTVDGVAVADKVHNGVVATGPSV